MPIWKHFADDCVARSKIVLIYYFEQNVLMGWFDAIVYSACNMCVCACSENARSENARSENDGPHGLT